MKFTNLLVPLKKIQTTTICNKLKLSYTNKGPYPSQSINGRTVISKTPCFLDVLNYLERPAIKDRDGLHTYKELITRAAKLSAEISKYVGKNKFISILCPHSSSYLISLWAGWLSGCAVVPLSLKHPPAMLDYFLRDSGSSILISSYRHLADQLKRSNTHVGIAGQ